MVYSQPPRSHPYSLAADQRMHMSGIGPFNASKATQLGRTTPWPGCGTCQAKSVLINVGIVVTTVLLASQQASICLAHAWVSPAL
jgi:hypothetical protein